MSWCKQNSILVACALGMTLVLPVNAEPWYPQGKPDMPPEQPVSQAPGTPTPPPAAVPVVPLAVAGALAVGLAIAAGGDDNDGGDGTVTPPQHTPASHH
ncbi:hypothetical protein C7443_101122 [Plasticicumulans acidivorans]|uniref:Uncharacterized protein n=2 Tax=Plasticicumulans acidivorans TaxID=886464 RepID=A0A317N140_9GAMM|nr:hypothetical protein C7443_101122 [Plasticicumulans acidivorans]